jgi:hypothetical protein
MEEMKIIYKKSRGSLLEGNMGINEIVSEGCLWTNFEYILQGRQE